MPSSVAGWFPETKTERTLTQEQLERILAHPAFKNSKRCPSLLRYVVEQTLQGNQGHFKERILGIEVFGRDPNYDTTQDPVVRTTAGEIRKRIAQYYHEPGHEAEIRIDLPPGSYLPEFHLAVESAISFSPVPQRIDVAPSATDFTLHRKPWLRSVLAAAMLGALVFVVLIKLWSAKSTLDQFWSPIFDGSGPVVLSVGQPKLASQTRFLNQTPTRILSNIFRTQTTSHFQMRLRCLNYPVLSGKTDVRTMCSALAQRRSRNSAKARTFLSLHLIILGPCGRSSQCVFTLYTDPM